MLTQERLKEVLKYDKDTGIFTWACNVGQRGRIGCVAGWNDKTGYKSIQLDNIGYKVHRLAWLYVHGYFPEGDIDHIDRDRANNKLSNIREVSRQCNIRNTGNTKSNSSGVKGVSYIVRDGKFCASIGYNRSTIRLGVYNDFEDAVCARLAGEQSLEWAGCDSSSPAYKYVTKNIQKRGI